MMKLQVQLFGRLGANLGSDILLEFSEQPTIRKVIQTLIQKDPSLTELLLKNNELSNGTILLVNGHIVDRSTYGMERELKTKDRMTIDRLVFLETVGGG
ncbi:MAG: MoaD/ThiS family protein [Candidatus Hodarchaeales archaeon]|jgi:molybdopterin converting factor small subunit